MTENNKTIMSKEQYGDKFQDHHLEQYKLYVEMADRISQRRTERNRYYLSLLSILLSVPSLIIALNISNEFQITFEKILFIGISLLGITLCSFWIANIHSYKKLNKAKFEVIIEMENNLPYSCYKNEWEKLGKERRYLQLTTIEKIIPVIFIIPYITLFIYSIIF